MDFIRIIDRESPISISVGDSKEKSMTVLTSCIRNFASLSKTVPLNQTITFLNSYLSEMEELVYKTTGFVDKYIGNEILALLETTTKEQQKKISILQTTRWNQQSKW